jgi:four helix bundle protein
MATIGRFEDLVAWQKARVMTREVYLMTRAGTFARDFGLAGQIQRASVSTMANIAEGFERGNRGEFHQFLGVARSSCAEVRSDLYVALDVGHIGQETFDVHMARADEVGRIVSGLRTSVGKQRRR